ncbi:MAG: hydrogenase [Phycisphaerae bacterium]|nr:hydrogenase [Phycisphaerae bacterium]
MELLLDTLLILLVLTNFRLLGSSRLAACIQTLAIQAVILGAMPLVMHASHLTVRVVAFAVAILGVKALLLPWLLRRAARESGTQRELEPLIGFTSSVLIGALLLAASFWVVRPLAQGMPAGEGLVCVIALFTILTGLLMIVSRRKALTQVLGYLAMENGVYAFGTALAVDEPLLVELGVLLDLLVAVFVMGIAIYHISREFDHIDTDQLSVLRD